MPFILNDKSPQYGQVNHALIDLKPHQKAILKKMVDMEMDFFQYIHDSKSKRMGELDVKKKREQQMQQLQQQLQQVQQQLQQGQVPLGQGQQLQMQLRKQLQELQEENEIQAKEMSNNDDLEPFGVLGSTVGSGKTYCIIALCLLEKYRKKNWVDKIFSSNTSMSTMIVVPSHLYYQWVDAIQIFAGNALTVQHFDDYDSVLNLYTEKTEITKNADIYLVSDLYYQMLASTLVTLRLSFKRIVLDEIDSINNSLHTAVGAAFTWFVSGSFRESLTKNKTFHFGDIEMNSKTLLKNYIGCDDQFVLESFSIPEYKFKSITCDNPTIDALKHCLNQESLYALNSCDPQTALNKQELDAVANIPNDKAFADILKKKWEEEIKQLEDYILSLEKGYKDISEKQNKRKVVDVQLSRNVKRIESEIEEKKKKYNDLKTNLQTLETELEKVQIFHEDRPKLVKLTNMIDAHKDKKVLIYAEFPRVLLEVTKYLEANDIKYSNFEGGNNEEMYKSVQRFKEEDDVNMFLAHSTLFSCGMNLENITHIIFLHRVTPEVQKQVIGRGQRPGRKEALTVYELLYKNEKSMK